MEHQGEGVVHLPQGAEEGEVGREGEVGMMGLLSTFRQHPRLRKQLLLLLQQNTERDLVRRSNCHSNQLLSPSS